MQSLNINQLVIDGLAPLSYASQHIIRPLLDMDALEESSMDDISKLSIPSRDFSQQFSLVNNAYQTLLSDLSFPNNNIALLLRSALISGAASFRQTLHDFKMRYKKTFAKEINQHDQRQNTLLWYLTTAGLYDSIKELYRLASIELDINGKNGLFNQTILHYAVIHGSIEKIQIVLDMGVHTNLSDRFGRTALHYIALYGTKEKNEVEIAKLLVDRGISPNLKDSLGQTTVHIAIIKANYNLVKYLILLANINVSIRDKQGYTLLCYLCESILNLSDTSLENKQCTDILEHIFQIMNSILDRCPSDKLSDNFHIVQNDEFGENLLLPVYDKLIGLATSFYTETLFDRLQSVILGTSRDHHLFSERLLTLPSWNSAVVALCNTDEVNVSNALIQCIVDDPHVVLTDNISPSCNSSSFFVLTFYSLATNDILLQNIVPMCKHTIKEKQKAIDQCNEIEECDLYINNYNLHTNYVTFIHTCLHYASSNVFSLKHLCRRSIRHYFQSHIINKTEECSHLKLEHRHYLQLKEVSLIYFEMHDLSSILRLIKRLYSVDQSIPSENQINDNLDHSEISISISSLINTSHDNEIAQDVLNRNDTVEKEYERKSEEIQLIEQRTIEEIMAQSDISYHDLSVDQIESKHLSESSIETSNTDQYLNYETNPQAILSFTNDEISSKQFEHELANVQTKSKDIEDMIDKFLSKT